MIAKRNFLISSIIFLSVFIVSTYYLFVSLAAESEVKRKLGVHEEIYTKLRQLPESYKQKNEENNGRIDRFIKNIGKTRKIVDYAELFSVANSWVTKTQIVDFESEHLGALLEALQVGRITKADLDPRGTQLKFLLTLEDKQTAVFKPQWYEKERIIEGPVYAGKDRYGSEIVAFYLAFLLNLPFIPPSAQRIISLTKDILPVATKRLLNTSFDHSNRSCVYGKCFYCKREDPICEDKSTHTLQGAVIFNLNGVTLKNNRSPWQRTYKKTKKAAWEEDENYCKYVRGKLTKKRLLDLIDVAIFDFLIQNGDRHHYETLYDYVVLLDNGKGFGNPHVQHLDILAPLYQCCMLRSSTMKNLQSLSGGTLREKLESMPNIANLLTTYHLEAIENRLLIVFATVEYCKSRDKSI